MNRFMSSDVRSGLSKMALAVLLIAIPAAGVAVPAHATPSNSGTWSGHGLLPADPPPPPTNTPPPGPPRNTYAPAQSGDNSWNYSTGDSGDGGGG
jgi:hypothetical protein